MESDHSLYPFTEYIKTEIFVRRMDSIALQPETHQDGLDAENLLEIADNRDTSSAPHCQRLLTKGLCKSLFCRLVSRMRNRAHIALTAMHRSYFDLNTFGSDALDIVGKQT